MFNLFKKLCLRRSLTGMMVAITLAACGSAPSSSPTSNSGSRYSIAQDRAPSGQVSLGSILEVIPEPVTRTLAGNRSPYSVLGKTYTVLPTEKGYSKTGIASWYGEKFHGHKTSNGEVFDMYQASAAHKSLPIPSFLRVTNLDNNRSLIVRVNDRGPFHGDRIIDLSYAAALKLGYADRGTARVQLDAIVVNEDGQAVTYSNSRVGSPEQGAREEVSGRRYLQVGAFSELRSAQRV
ncbi:MAG: septal ring lytic transglycosylase RlpA family protein, partial [Pseudomonadota bacterium]|nr:septal ring lytic transglycosylase RlpA family protein [Pseudomonadota bacterium]MEC8700697.1 septal ring lytic transglycosylase RlpA family protein [Pseudomonadota bacterium]